jgi:predicted NBD/HSP70 family sugar kinase
VPISEVRRQFAHVQLEPTELSLASLAGNPLAARVISAAGRRLGRVLADVCNALNPEAIIVGGELGTAGDPLLAGIRESIDRFAQPAAAHAVRIRAAELGLRTELLGAIATAVAAVA